MFSMRRAPRRRRNSFTALSTGRPGSGLAADDGADRAARSLTHEGTSCAAALYYIGSVFRYDEPQSGRLRGYPGRPRAHRRVGPAADASDAVTIEAMMALGLRDFRVDVGHVGLPPE